MPKISPYDRSRSVSARISALLTDPAVSVWLKARLKDMFQRDLLDFYYDLKVLETITYDRLVELGAVTEHQAAPAPGDDIPAFLRKQAE